MARAQLDTARIAVPPVIEAIQFERHNVFRESEARGFVPRLINRLHVRTQPGVIEREVLFAVGERYDSAAVTETERNLRSLRIFSEVSVDTVHTEAGLVVRVVTQDGWSTKPEFTFRTTGGQIAYRLSLFEENLLGTASRLSVSYTKDPDRTATLFGFRQPRLVAGRIGLGVFYDDRSDGYLFSGQIVKPYVSLESRNAWGGTVETRDERILRYFEGETVASDTVRRLLDGVGVGYGWALRADRRGYLRLGLAGRIWQDDFLRRDSVIEGSRVAYGALTGTLEWRHARYVLTRGFRANREEDVDLSTTVRGGLALTPAAFGYERNGVVPSLVARTGGIMGRKAFAYIDLIAHGRFTGAGLDSGMVQTGATVVLLPAPSHAAVVHAWGGWLHNPRPGGEFDLGLGVGPRGYRLHSFSGDRGLFTTAEYRYMLAEDFAQLVDVGVAAFVDYGGAWYSGSRRRLGWDYGVGLRVGTSRSTDLLLNRIDLVRRVGSDREPGGWVLVIGKGLVFSTTGLFNR